MDIKTEIKFLQRRVFMLEHRLEQTQRLFEVQAIEMQQQNSTGAAYCTQCGMDVSNMQQDTCPNENCICGLN